MTQPTEFGLHHYGPHGSTKWYPLLLHDQLSINQLNELLEKGWYIPMLDSSRVRFPVFYITPELHRNLHRDLGEPSHHPDADANSLPLVMLRHGDVSHAQVAVQLPVDSKGYKDLGALLRFLREEKDGWESHLMLSITPTLAIAILEKRK